MTAAGLRISPLDAAALGLSGALGRLREGFARYVEARSRSVAVRELRRLSDATLADLGIPRGRIREYVRDRSMPWS